MNINKKTRDLYLAAAYLALGAKYEGSDKTDPRNMEFIFSPKLSDSAPSDIPVHPLQDLEYVETQWINGTLLVSAVAYADAIKRMKSLVHTK